MALANGLTPKQDAFVRSYLECGDAHIAAMEHDIELGFTQPQSGAYVYLLLTPDDNRVLYVGKGRGNRMHHHVRDVKRGKVTSLKKHNAIKACLDRGVVPMAVVFSAYLTDSEALQIEKSLILRIGRDHLSNSVPGTGCPHLKLLAHIAECEARIMPFDQWVAKRNPDPKNYFVHASVLNGLQEAREMVLEQLANAA